MRLKFLFLGCLFLMTTIAFAQQNFTNAEKAAFTAKQDSLLDVAYEAIDTITAEKINLEVDAFFKKIPLNEHTQYKDFLQGIKYNSACIFSLKGSVQKSLILLEQSILAGYADFEHFLNDPDLANIRNSPRFVQTIKNYKESKQLKHFSKEALIEDITLMKNSIQEAHTGVFWYQTPKQYDSLFLKLKADLKEGQTALNFYGIAGQLISNIKEGHCEIKLDVTSKNNLISNGKFLPVCVKYLDGKLFIINEIAGVKGLEIVSINNKNVAEITNQLFSVIPSDGYNTSLKYDWLNNGQFAWFYAIINPQNETNVFELIDPNSGKKTIVSLKSVDYLELNAICTGAGKPFTRLEEIYTNGITFIDSLQTAIINLPDFYNDAPDKFHQFIDTAFAQIDNRKIKHLVIDVRANEGGYEGYEDYLLSYLTNKPYQKYKYVQGSALTYSFYEYTHLNTQEKVKRFEKSLNRELFLDGDGRIIRRANFMPPAPVRSSAFSGDLYVLTSGLTYSGGSELASLIKAHRQAVFIGNETGGGYYGQTSGFFLLLTLPNTKLVIRIPLLKFSVNELNKDIPIGRGVIPDFKLSPTLNDYLNGIDTELDYTINLIRDRKK